MFKFVVFFLLENSTLVEKAVSRLILWPFPFADLFGCCG